MNKALYQSVFYKSLIQKDALASSIKLAIIVGTFLNLINQYPPLIALDFEKISFGKLILTYFVPFFGFNVFLK